MASELTNLTAQIVISHASVTELTPRELVKTIKEVYGALAALAAEEVVAEAAPRPRRVRKVKMIESPEAKAIEEEGPVFGDPDYMEFMESREG